MAVAVGVSLAEYIATTYDPDCDYVDGEVRERNVGDWNHSTWQGRLLLHLGGLERRRGIFVVPETRVQVRPDRFRIPDITVTLAKPTKRWVTEPPYLVVEILSDGQSLSDIQDRIADYVEFGIPHIWVVDPVTVRGWDASSGTPVEARDGILKTGHPEIAINLRELAE
jgi:Uma2 family endonuclease